MLVSLLPFYWGFITSLKSELELRFRGVALAGALVFITYPAPRGCLFAPLAQMLNDWGLLGELAALAGATKR
jgi:ABC-type glycerol-3-phosphate transport system permease component